MLFKHLKFVSYTHRRSQRNIRRFGFRGNYWNLLYFYAFLDYYNSNGFIWKGGWPRRLSQIRPWLFHIKPFQFIWTILQVNTLTDLCQSNFAHPLSPLSNKRHFPFALFSLNTESHSQQSILSWFCSAPLSTISTVSPCCLFGFIFIGIVSETEIDQILNLA